MTDRLPVKSLETYSATYAPGLLVHTENPPHAYGIRAGCALTIDGEPTDPDGLWAWFRKSREVTVAMETDPDHYGAVSRAEFAAGT